MTITITIDCDNAAFHDDEGHQHAGPEVARILRDYADEITDETHPEDMKLRDVNGNTVGRVSVTP